MNRTKTIENKSVISSDAYLRIFESALDAMIIADDNANYVEVNKAACELLGYSKEEFKGKNVADITPGATIDSVKDLWAQFLQKKEMEGEFPMLTKSGEIKITHFKAVSNFIPGYHLSILRDISESKRTEFEKEATLKLLAVLNSESDFNRMLGEVTKLIEEWSGAEIIAVRQSMFDEDHFIGNHNSLKKHFDGDNVSCVHKRVEPNETHLEVNPEVKTSCICGAVLNNRFDVNTSFFTEYGSFITNNSSKEIKDFAEYLNVSFNETCFALGFESILLIPLRSGKHILGLLQIMDSKPGKFSPEKVSLFERVAANLSIAIAHRKGQEKLRESEIQHRLLFETMAQGVVFSNSDGIVVSTNIAASKILGISQKELIGSEVFSETWNVLKEDNSIFSKEEYPVNLALETSAVIRDVLVGFYNPILKARRWLKVNSIPQFRYGESKPFQVYTTLEDITEQKKSKDELTDSLKEKETLLKEIHHRVKNNLQIISSLLNLQSSYIKDSAALEVMRESQNRVRSMALIHETLYRYDDFSKVDFSQFLSDLINILQSSYYDIARGVSIELNLEQVALPIDTAIPLGLLVNEVMSNSFKHAFPEKNGGKVTVSMALNRGNLNLSIKDNGIGLPEGFEIEKLNSLGFKLIQSLVSQIDASLEVKSAGGTEILIKLKMIK